MSSAFSIESLLNSTKPKCESFVNQLASTQKPRERSYKTLEIDTQKLPNWPHTYEQHLPSTSNESLFNQIGAYKQIGTSLYGNLMNLRPSSYMQGSCNFGLHTLQQYAATLEWNDILARLVENQSQKPDARSLESIQRLHGNKNCHSKADTNLSRTNAKKYRCDVCEKTFSRSNTLVTHKRIHTGEKPFRCEHCGRAFRQPGNLTRHRLTHTAVKPYVCTLCEKAFNRASNLHTHMRTHSQLATMQPSATNYFNAPLNNPTPKFLFIDSTDTN